MINFKTYLALFFTTLSTVNGFPQSALVMSSSTVTTLPTTTSGFIADDYEDLYPDSAAKSKPKVEADKNIIKEFKVDSQIQFRFAHTTVESYLKNPSPNSREVTFSMILPDTAFVSNFSMILKDGEEFVAKVEEKTKAKKIYDAALKQDSAAGIVHRDTRNANQIVVSVNVEGHGKARFRLTYEELLQRHLSHYQHIVHLNLDQAVEDFSVQVSINESLPIVRLRVPELKTDPNSIDSTLKDNELAIVKENFNNDPKQAKILFQPDVATQKRIIESNNNDNKEAFQGQLIVEYDVDRKDDESDVQLMDGYFVHFFAPDSLATLPKHVVFVIDISGSMFGEKLKQTKDAMVTILDDLTEKDYFNIILFSDGVEHWRPEQNSEASPSLTYKGTKELKKAAVKFVVGLSTRGSTNIHDAMIEALKQVTEVKTSEVSIPSNVKSLIIFLTDGEPTVGITNGPEIERRIAEVNRELRVPIYGLAFGHDADFSLIKSISLTSSAFARKIFDGSDAAIQLEDFYKDLANPLLSNVTFNYVGKDFSSLTNSNDNKTFFRGNEFVVAGKLTDLTSNEVVIGGEGENGKFQKKLFFCPLPFPLNTKDSSITESPIFTNPMPGCIRPQVRPVPTDPRPVNFIERLWAFLTIKNLLSENGNSLPEKLERVEEEEKEEEQTSLSPQTEETISTDFTAEKKSPEDKALELALKYNFVTKLTSLVVKRPSAGEKLEPEVDEIRIDPLPFTATSKSSVHNFMLKGFAPSTYGVVLAGGTRGGQFSAIKNIKVPQLIAPQYDLFESAYDDDASSEQATTTMPTLQLFPCNITLYSQTYLRGESFTTSDNVQDLSENNFDDKATSVQIPDHCCWILYTEKKFGGILKKLQAGVYKSATDLGKVFRDASSLKKC